MAIAFMAAAVHGRSGGWSAPAGLAYRFGARVEDERTGLVHDYTHRQLRAALDAPTPIDASILAPEGAPPWARDVQALATYIDLAERRKDAQLMREVLVAVPRELDERAAREIVHRYAAEQFVARGMVAAVAIHRHDPDNPHAHLLLTMRDLEADGFGKKVREWNDRSLVEHWRDAWGREVNQALERAGERARIDMRSYARQELDLMPVAVGAPQRHVAVRPAARELAAAVGEHNGRVIDLAAARAQREQLGAAGAYLERLRGEIAATQAELAGLRERQAVLAMRLEREAAARREAAAELARVEERLRGAIAPGQALVAEGQGLGTQIVQARELVHGADDTAATAQHALEAIRSLEGEIARAAQAQERSARLAEERARHGKEMQEPERRSGLFARLLGRGREESHPATPDRSAPPAAPVEAPHQSREQTTWDRALYERVAQGLDRRMPQHERDARVAQELDGRGLASRQIAAAITAGSPKLAREYARRGADYGLLQAHGARYERLVQQHPWHSPSERDWQVAMDLARQGAQAQEIGAVVGAGSEYVRGLQPGQAEQYVGRLGERAVERAGQEEVEREAARQAWEARHAAEQGRRAREHDRDQDDDRGR